MEIVLHSTHTKKFSKKKLKFKSKKIMSSYMRLLFGRNILTVDSGAVCWRKISVTEPNLLMVASAFRRGQN